MVPHPDGSNRAFFSSQAGKIWLATIPEKGSGGVLGLDESKPFVDLTDEVNFDTQFGMMGLAFHPNFAQNGRFFASFNCDKVKWPGCSGRCSCNSDVNCDPSKLPADSGSQPCQHQSVVAEYTVNGSASQPSLVQTSRHYTHFCMLSRLQLVGSKGCQFLFSGNNCKAIGSKKNNHYWSSIYLSSWGTDTLWARWLSLLHDGRRWRSRW